MTACFKKPSSFHHTTLAPAGFPSTYTCSFNVSHGDKCHRRNVMCVPSVGSGDLRAALSYFKPPPFI